jgi:DnaJ-class molecular chaperone
MVMSNYYLALGIEKEADIHKIKKAYRICCKKYHPDTKADKETKERFLVIQKAYETLSDEDKRREYDKSLDQQEYRRPSFRETLDRQRNVKNHHIKEFFSLMDDFFEGFVPGFFETGFSQHKELYLELILSPEEARNGGDFPVDIPVLEVCTSCHGTGYSQSFVCFDCSGYGHVRSARTMVLHVPAHVTHGIEARVSLEGIGLKNLYLNVEILVQPFE